MSSRPSVTVIVPYTGSDDGLRACVQALGRLIRRDGDEMLVADNRRRPGSSALPAAADGGARVVVARGRCAPGFARNRAAALAAGEWLVFVDADTRPGPGLLDSYFDPPPRAGTAVLAGRILDVPGGRTLAARHSARRAQLSQRVTLDRAGTPYAQSANMAVRRSAFHALGGFDDNARAGEDADLCFRLARAGWQLEERPGAVVEHASRGTLTGLVAQLARHGSGAAWLNRRYPGEFPPPTWSAFGRRTARAAVQALAAAFPGPRPTGSGDGRRELADDGRRELAGAALVELIGAWAFEAGRLLPNRARRS
jgi:GT2 family glycosyltransferase